MRHTNLSSAVKQAKELAKKNGKSHYANGSSGRYKVGDKKPEDSSFVQATPSGGEWSHKMNQATKTFTKSRIFGGVTMEEVEWDWGQEGTMKDLLNRLEEGGGPRAGKYPLARTPTEKEKAKFDSWMKNLVSDANEAIRDFKQGNTVVAAQGIQDMLSGLQGAVYAGYDPKAPAVAKALDAIIQAKRAVYKMERAVSLGEI